jgi:hypothetical protein
MKSIPRHRLGQFSDPIVLPGRRPLLTLRNAAQYIMKLPRAEHDAEEWQAAMQALILVAEHDGPTMFARIGVMRALNRRVERVLTATGKTSIGDAGSWRGIDDVRQQVNVRFCSVVSTGRRNTLS